MKNSIILLTVLLLFASGCREKDEVEIIPDYDKVYLPLNKVDKTPQLAEGDEAGLTASINEKLNEADKEKIKLDYKIFVDEKGNVNKIQIVESPGENFNNLVVEKIKDWKFEPAVKNGDPVKSQYRWKFYKNLTSENGDVDPDEFTVTAEEMPMPVGGITEIQQNVVYPEIAKKAGVEGKVFVKAFINAEGKVVRTEIIKGVGSGLDEAAMNAIKKTRWLPGKNNGKPVKTQVSIPIVFKLQ